MMVARRRLGAVVKRAREVRGLTQVELAKKAQLSQGYVSKLEVGDQKNPSIAVLKRLAKALGVPVAELLEQGRDRAVSNPSGAGVATWKTDTVLDYLRQQFPEETVDHLPKPDQMADLFRVISAYQPRHQLLIRRRFFDDQIPDVAALRDVLAGITERMRRAGGETYIELN
jgi:transcriptional regulator with XRE-family HTH domain